MAGVRCRDVLGCDGVLVAQVTARRAIRAYLSCGPSVPTVHAKQRNHPITEIDNVAKSE